MAEEYIVVGASSDGEGGYKTAPEAKDIESLVIAHKDGTTEEVSYHPGSTNPGQDTLQYIDENYPEAKGIVTGKMRGPENYNKRAIINEDEESIERIVEKYKNGEYDAEIDEYSLEEKAEEGKIGEPQKTGAGKGIRAEKGRGGHPPEEQEEYGKGSGTKYGRAAEGEPRERAYESESSGDESEDNQSEESTKKYEGSTESSGEAEAGEQEESADEGEEGSEEGSGEKAA